MKPVTVVQIFEALDDLHKAAAPFLDRTKRVDPPTRYERSRLVSTYQQARLVVVGKRGDVDEFRDLSDRVELTSHGLEIVEHAQGLTVCCFGQQFQVGKPATIDCVEAKRASDAAWRAVGLQLADFLQGRAKKGGDDVGHAS